MLKQKRIKLAKAGLDLNPRPFDAEENMLMSRLRDLEAFDR